MIIAYLISNPQFNMHILLTKREVKMAGYWPRSLSAFLWTETKSSGPYIKCILCHPKFGTFEKQAPDVKRDLHMLHVEDVQKHNKICLSKKGKV